MPGIRAGHVVGELQRLVPRMVAIKSARTKASCAIYPAVFVDSLDSTQELVVAREEMAIVIEIVNVDFKPTSTHVGDKRRRNAISSLGHDLEGRLDLGGVVHLHQL